MIERSEWKFLGRVIGTCTGWDDDEDTYTIYEFEPAEGIDLPKCDGLNIAIVEGTFTCYDTEGNEFVSKSVFEVLR